jgi:HAD superfamily hydrolase (TIGR01509 family)
MNFDTFNLNEYRALIFDFDGVLVDTVEMAAQVVRGVATQFGIRLSETASADFSRLSYHGIASALTGMSSVDIPEETVYDTVCGYMAEMYGSKAVIAIDTAEFIKIARERGKLLAIATSNTMKNVCSVLDNSGMSSCFAGIFCPPDRFRSKPDPYVYKELLRSLGLAASECLAFEDDPAGVMSASAAGITVLRKNGEGIPDFFSFDELIGYWI